ncbi:MAG: cytochrome c oxidase subunit II [Thermomicrobiales bacterium]
MKIHAFERFFLVTAAILIILGAAAIGVSYFTFGVRLPGPVARLDPQTTGQTAPFDNPGLHQTGDKQYDAVLVANLWQWTPNAPGEGFTVPVGSTVTFKVASTNVMHGFMIRNTNINSMVIPGEVTQVTYTFDKPGEYLIICHEYCGIGHQDMFSKVVVEA